jgi:hypothetical protein
MKQASCSFPTAEKSHSPIRRSPLLAIFGL